MRFTKMHAVGNDYIYLDAIHQELPADEDLPDLARRLSDRHFGVGSDGIVLICPSEVADLRMRMFNADGSESEMCGSALRCVGTYAYEKGLVEKTALTVETLAGIQHVWLTVEAGVVADVRADIGSPSLSTAEIPVITELAEFVEQPVESAGRTFLATAVSVGNPHCVIFVDDVGTLDVERHGRPLENLTELFPNRTNVSFAQVIAPDYVLMREWERGSGITLACGTGSCATAVAGVVTGRLGRSVTVEEPGGCVLVEWDEATGHVFLSGPGTTVFDAQVDPARIKLPRA